MPFAATYPRPGKKCVGSQSLVTYAYQQDKSKISTVTYGNGTDKCLEIEETTQVRITDEQAKVIIEKYSGCKSVADFQRLDAKQKEKYISVFKQKGVSIRQISRLTGTSYYIVQKTD